MVIGLLNSDTGGVIVFGIANDINENVQDPVEKFMVGHAIARARIEELAGYLKERIWPQEVWMIHIKQLPISKSEAITTVYVGRGRSKPYLYYVPNHPQNGVRSFARGSRVTYELEAPQLHRFLIGGSGPYPITEEQPHRPKAAKKGQVSPNAEAEAEQSKESKGTNVSSLLEDNFKEVTQIIKDPEQFGLITVCVCPSSQNRVSDEEIEKLLQPAQRNVKRMEEIWYGEMQVSQKWYRRLFVPYQLSEERKCTWVITCQRKTGIMFVNSLVDAYMQGKRYLNPFYLSYQIQRLLQMANELYQGQVGSMKLTVDFRYIETFGYLTLLFGSVESIKPYVAYAGPIEREVKAENIYGGERADILMPTVQECMTEVAKIFGLMKLPNPLSNPKGEMIFVEYFKGIR